MLIWMRHTNLALQLLKHNLQNRNGRDVLEATEGLRQRPEQILNELMVSGCIDQGLQFKNNSAANINQAIISLGTLFIEMCSELIAGSSWHFSNKKRFESITRWHRHLQLTIAWREEKDA